MPERAAVVSAVIPTFNRRELVVQAVESALACGDDIEVVVVDDGSTDDTAERLSAFGDRIVVVQQANAGRSAARNAGLALARGRYVCFLDSDDVWEPWHVAQLRDALQATTVGEHGSSTVFSAPALLWDPTTGSTQEPDASLAFTVNDLREAALVGTVLPLQGLFVPRDLLTRIGAFDEGLQGSEDYVLLVHLTRSATVVRLTRPSVRIRLHAGRSMSDVDWDVTWRRAAADRILDSLGADLSEREVVLVRASSSRYAAARLYEVGRMRAARAALRASRAEVPLVEGWGATARLWLQTWLGPLAGVIRDRRSRRRRPTSA